jgi:O-antigen/teichoic acid export membrane protein
MLTGLVYVIRFFGLPGVEKAKGYLSVLKDLLRYGFLNQVAHITQMLSFRLSYYILDAYHGEASVGIYSNAIALAESIWLISKSISLVQYARIANTDDKQYAASLTVKLIKASFLLSLLLIIPLVLLPEGFYRFIFGAEFGPVRYVVLSLAAGVVMYNFSILTGHYFSGRGKYHVNAVVSSIGLGLSVAVYYLLIPQFAELGAGYATSISYAFTSIFITGWFIFESGLPITSFLPSIKDFKELKQSAKR